MRGWLVGLLIGGIVGAGAMYLALRPPWGRATSSEARIDAGAGVVFVDAGAAKPKKRRGSTRTVPGADPDVAPDETEPAVLTAQQRALEWRGDEVTAGMTKIDVADGHEARSLDEGEIQRALAEHGSGVRACVVQSATGAELRATITIKLAVDGTGRVTRSRVEAPRYLFEKGLLGCAQRALRAMRFPAVGGATVVTFPIHLG